MTKLYNGTTVKEKDVVAFYNSDEILCVGVVYRTQKGLRFWNNGVKIKNYQNAFLLTKERLNEELKNNRIVMFSNKFTENYSLSFHT